MKNIVILLFVAGLLSSCEEADYYESENDRWYIEPMISVGLVDKDCTDLLDSSLGGYSYCDNYIASKGSRYYSGGVGVFNWGDGPNNGLNKIIFCLSDKSRTLYDTIDNKHTYHINELDTVCIYGSKFNILIDWIIEPNSIIEHREQINSISIGDTTLVRDNYRLGWCFTLMRKEDGTLSMIKDSTGYAGMQYVKNWKRYLD